MQARRPADDFEEPKVHAPVELLRKLYAEAVWAGAGIQALDSVQESVEPGVSVSGDDEQLDCVSAVSELDEE